MLVGNPRKQRLNIIVRDSIGFTDLTVGIGEVDLGSLQDTVPTDRIVALWGGWGLFGKRSSGEILLRLTYKTYVEDEDDDTVKVEFMDNYASDDDILDAGETNNSDGPSEDGQTARWETESFMDVLTALLLSEEFQGIVASETGNNKSSKDPIYTGPILTGARDRNADVSLVYSEGISGASGDSALLWLATITSIAVLISVNIGGSSFFNP